MPQQEFSSASANGPSSTRSAKSEIKDMVAWQVCPKVYFVPIIPHLGLVDQQEICDLKTSLETPPNLKLLQTWPPEMLFKPLPTTQQEKTCPFCSREVKKCKCVPELKPVTLIKGVTHLCYLLVRRVALFIGQLILCSHLLNAEVVTFYGSRLLSQGGRGTFHQIMYCTAMVLYGLWVWWT